MRRIAIPTAVIAAAAFSVPLATADHKPNHDTGKPYNVPDLSIEATPNPVLWSLPVTFSGRLSGNDRSGKTVELQASPAPYTAAYTTVKTAVTNSQGRYTLSLVPEKNTNFRARIAGAPDSVSIGLLVRTRMKVTRRVSDRTPRRGQRVTFRGRVSPAHDGRRVYIQRLNRDGKYRTVKLSRLRDAGTAFPTSSKYKRTMRIYRDGRFRVMVRSDSDHMRNVSRRIRLDVPPRG